MQPVNAQETDFVLYNFHAVPALWEQLCQHYLLRVTTRPWPTLAATSYQVSTRYEPDGPRRAYYNGIYRDVFRGLRLKMRDLPSVG